MPDSLPPDPIRVQSCVCCLFRTNRNSIAVTSHYPIRVMNPSIGAISKKYLRLLKLYLIGSIIVRYLKSLMRLTSNAHQSFIPIYKVYNLYFDKIC